MAAIIANNQQQQSSVFPIKVFELNGSEEKWKEEKADNLETVQCDDAIGSSVQDEEEDRSSSLMSDECKQKQQQVKHDGCQIVSAPNPQPNEATNSRKMTNPVNAAYVETSLDDLSYTSGEASGPDADEEEERRLIARLQMENKQRQQEQQMAGQRQQQPLDPQQANQKAPNRAGETPVGGAQQALMEEQQRAASAKNVPPQVPVRRSSRVARMSSDCQVQQAADNCSLHQRRLATRNVAPPNRQHPRAAPPVPLAQTSLFGTATVAGRLPTRQPPMQVPPPQPPPPPPPPPRGHQRRRAPKNIWSPSSSSVMSSSFEEDEEQPASQPNDTHTSDEQFPRVESPATLQSESSPPPPTKVVREQQVLISELVSDEQRAADNELDRQLAQDRWSGRTSLDEPATATSTATSGTAETTIANKPLRTEDYELQQQKREQAGNKVADDEKQAAEVVGGISRAPVSSCGAASRSTPIGELGGSPFAGHERGGANSNWRSFSVSLANPARANEQIPRLQGQRMMRGQTLRSFSVAVATPPAAKLRQQQSGEAQSAPGTKDDEREAVCGPATLPRDSGLSEATRAKTNSDWQLQQQRRQRQQQQQEPPQQQLDPKQGPHQSESNDDATQLAQCASEQHSGNSASAAEAVVGNSINGQANVVSGQQSDMPEAATATAAAIAMAMASAEQQTIPMVLASSALETSTMAPAALEQLQTADQRARESDSVGVAGAELANRHNKQAHSMTLDPNENELERGQMEYEDCDEQKPSSGFYKSTTVTSKTTVTKSKDEWFQQMYKQMHSGPSTSKPTAERSILNAVNEQNRRLRDTKSGDQLIKIKLKSPRNEYRSSFFDEDSDLAHRHSPSDSSPAAQAARATKTLAPNIGLATNERHFSRQTSGLASDHLPEQSSMSQQQRNLDLGSQSVWPQTHTEHKRIYPCHLRGDSPIRHLNDNQDEGHEKRCVFSRLIKDEPSAFQQQASTGGSLDRKLAATTSEYPEDSHKQYVAVQQGQDIPLKGLRRPPPQANVYKVGPVPPPFELDYQDPATTQQRFREHNLRLARSLGRNHRSFEATKFDREQRLCDEQTLPTRHFRSSSQSRGDEGSRQLDDIYKDFDTIYRCLSEHKPAIELNRPDCGSLNRQKDASGQWSAAAAFEALALAESLADVKNEALICGTPQYNRHIRQQQPDCPPENYADLMAAQRADSRNTNQSSLTNGAGPALVEEMTLSDLEEEICSTLMAAKDDERQRRFAEQQRQLLSGELVEHLTSGRRSRAPLPSQLFAPIAQQNRQHVSTSSTRLA